MKPNWIFGGIVDPNLGKRIESFIHFVNEFRFGIEVEWIG
jgi:hypothetical protein